LDRIFKVLIELKYIKLKNQEFDLHNVTGEIIKSTIGYFRHLKVTKHALKVRKEGEKVTDI
jgi:hypothetical protein